MDEANDNDLGWYLLPKEDGVYLHFKHTHETINLGPKEQVFTVFVDTMAAEDFGE